MASPTPSCRVASHARSTISTTRLVPSSHPSARRERRAGRRSPAGRSRGDAGRARGPWRALARRIARTSPIAAAVDDRRRRPAGRRPAVEDEVDGVAEGRRDLGRIRALPAAGPVGRRRRQRPESAGEGSRGVRGPGRAGRSSSRRRSARPGGPIGPLRHDDRQPAGPEGRPRGPRRRRHRRPIAAAWAGVGEEQHDRPVRRSPLHLEQPVDAARRVERDADPVDRSVGMATTPPARHRRAAIPASSRPSAPSADDRGRSRAAAFRRWSASAARRCEALAARRRGFARTSGSIMVATPSSSTGGAM